MYRLQGSHVTERFNAHGERDPRHGSFSVTVSGGLASNERLSRALSSVLVADCAILSSSLPSGCYRVNTHASQSSTESNKFSSRLEWEVVRACPTKETVRGFLKKFSRFTAAAVSRLERESGLRSLPLTISIEMGVSENSANADLMRSTTYRGLLETVARCLEQKCWFSPQQLVASLRKFERITPEALLRLVYILGGKDEHDLSPRHRFASLSTAALIPRIIDSGLLDPDRPFPERDDLLCHYIPLSELRQCLKDRITQRQVRFDSLAKTPIDVLCQNEMDNARDPEAIHYNEGIAALNAFNRSKTWTTIERKYQVTTFGDFLSAVKRRVILPEVIELLVDSDLFSVEYAPALVAIHPSLEKSFVEARTRIRDSEENTLKDSNFRVGRSQ